MFIVFPPWIKLIFGFPPSFSTMYWAASIFLIATSPAPCWLIALDTSCAASDSPSALIMVALVSCSYIITTNLAFSAICCATCFCSIDAAKSWENCKWVIETSSKIRPNSVALLYSCSLMSWETFSLSVMSSPASYYATIDLRTSLPIDGSTLSS